VTFKISDLRLTIDANGEKHAAPASANANLQSSILNFMPLIECVPNVSEGRRPEIVAAMAETIARVPGVRLLDRSSDPSHNRSVLTLLGDGPALEAAILSLFERAVADIDLRSHRGEHPRVGAVDVVPFVPLEGATMADCVALAKKVGAAVATRFSVPVYLYEEASANPARRNLEDIRRGEFEGLAGKMASVGWAPDFGDPKPHPTAGATVIGARMPLIAYNINLATDRLDVAKKIATAIRFSSGGFRYVKAMGVSLQDRGIVQVSMNLTNYEKTPIFRVFEVVRQEAARYGVEVLESEVVGLVPSAALTDAAEYYLRLAGFSRDQILEHRLRATIDETNLKSEV
jgi:glutamate formiminotransferase